MRRLAALLVAVAVLAALLPPARAHVHGAHACAHDALPLHPGVAAGERHAQCYVSHPFARAAAAAAAPAGARRLAQAAGNTSRPLSAGGYAPLRIALDWRGDGGSGAASALPTALLLWLRFQLVPAAAAWWRSALQVWPVDGPLTLAQPVACSPLPADTSPLVGPFAGADVVLRVFVAPMPGGGGGSGASGGSGGASLDECARAAVTCNAATQACSAAAVACGTQDATSAPCAAADAACDAAVDECSYAAALCDATRTTTKVTPASAVAFASTCARDAYDRPIAGVLTFVPFYLSSPALAAAAAAWLARAPGSTSATSDATSADGDAALAALLALPAGEVRRLLFVAMHEIGHALGFAAASVPLFRDGATGLRRADAADGPAPYATSAAEAAALNASQALLGGLPSSVMVAPPERGHTSCSRGAPEQCVFKLTTPACAAAAGRHFGCADVAALRGPELENQDTSGSLSYGSHWEMRLFASELMAPILLFDAMYVSEVSLAFFEDSGWYVPRYDVARATSAGPRARWGLRQGCDFALRECVSPVAGATATSASVQPPSVAPPSPLATPFPWSGVAPAGSPPHFCAVPGAAACTYDLSGPGTCSAVPFRRTDWPELSPYMYYANLPGATSAQRLQGGFVSAADYCPIVLPAASGSCAVQPAAAAAPPPPAAAAAQGGPFGTDAADAPRTVAGQLFGASSLCVMSTLGPTDATSAAGLAAAPGCYATSCSAGGLELRVSALGADGTLRTVTCLPVHEGRLLPLPGFAGGLVCPPLRAACGEAIEPCDAALRPFGFSGTTAAVGYAAAAVVALALCVYTPLRARAAWAAGAPARAAAANAAAQRRAARAQAVAAEAELMRVAANFHAGAAPPAPPQTWGDENGGDADAQNVNGEDDDARGASNAPPPPQPPPPLVLGLRSRAAALRDANQGCCAPGACGGGGVGGGGGGCSRGSLASLLRGHPGAMLARSVRYAWSHDGRDRLAPGAVVRVRTYTRTQGWGAAEVHLQLADATSAGDVAPGGAQQLLPPPPPLPPGAGWRPELARATHAGLFTVSTVARDARGAPLYCLAAVDYQYGGDGRNAGRSMVVRRAWGGAAGGPPQLPEAPEALAAADVAVTAGASLYGAFAGGGGGGGDAATSAAGLEGWTPYFYRESLHAPPIAALPPAARPRAAALTGLGGAPLRRLFALFTLHGPITFLLVCLEATGALPAALQARCVAAAGAAWRFAAARGAAAGALTAAATYACRAGAAAFPHAGIELLPARVFWPAAAAVAAAATGAALWAACLVYGAASGGLPLPVGPAAAVVAGTAQLGYLCADVAGPSACGAAALRAVGAAWAAAVLADGGLAWPALLLLSRHVWADGLGADVADGDDVAHAAEACADHAGAPKPAPQQQQQQRAPQQRSAAAAAAAASAWGGGDSDSDEDDVAGGDALASPGVGHTWHNPTFDSAAAAAAAPAAAAPAPSAPPLTRAAALRVESAWD